MNPPGSAVPQWALSDRLRKIRRDRHLTQDEIALQLGVKPVTWAAWEAGRTRPHDVIGLATAIETRYGVPAAWTLGVLTPPGSATHPEGIPIQDGIKGRRWNDFLVAVL